MFFRTVKPILRIKKLQLFLQGRVRFCLDSDLHALNNVQQA